MPVKILKSKNGNIFEPTKRAGLLCLAVEEIPADAGTSRNINLAVDQSRRIAFIFRTQEQFDKIFAAMNVVPAAGAVLPGIVAVKEQLEPFSTTNPTNGIKYPNATARAAGLMCTVKGKPVYRDTFYTSEEDTPDVLVAHDNGIQIEEIARKMNGNIEQNGGQSAKSNKPLQDIDPILIPYRKGNSWGFCTPEMKVIVPCVYDWCDYFSEGFAVIRTMQGKYGFINKSNRFLIPPILDFASNFSEGVAYINNDYINGYVNAKKEIAIQIDRRFKGTVFKSGFAFIWDHEFTQLINKRGEVIEEAGWQEGLDYNENYVLHDYRKSSDNIDGILFTNVNTRESFRGSDIYVNCKQQMGFGEAQPYSEGLAAVTFNVGYYPNTEQLRDTLWGYIDQHQQLVIDTVFSKCSSFSEGLAAASHYKSKGLIGYIDKSGEYAIQPKYLFGENFHQGLAYVVDENRKHIIINENGSMQITISDSIDTKNDSKIFHRRYFLNGYFQYVRERDLKICTIDKKGTQYWED